jgi:hypothetical protein
MNHGDPLESVLAEDVFADSHHCSQCQLVIGCILKFLYRLSGKVISGGSYEILVRESGYVMSDWNIP